MKDKQTIVTPSLRDHELFRVSVESREEDPEETNFGDAERDVAHPK